MRTLAYVILMGTSVFASVGWSQVRRPPARSISRPTVVDPAPPAKPAADPVLPTPDLTKDPDVGVDAVTRETGEGTDGAAAATENEPSAPKVMPSAPVQEPAVHLNNSEARLAGRHIPVLIDYLPFDMILPSKIGLTAGYAPNTRESYEIQYARGYLTTPWLIANLGAISDERITIMKRQRLGGTNFFVSYGASYMDINASLGNKYLNQIPGAPASVHILRTQSLGAHVGIGQRWDVWKGMLLGIDYLDYTQPLIVTRRESLFLDYAWNDAARSDVQRAMQWITYFPRFTFLRLQFGWQF